MALVKITKTSVSAYLQNGEVKIPDDVKLGVMIISACNKVAGYVNSCPANPTCPLSTNEVPAELESTVCILVKWSIISSVPSMAAVLEGTTRSMEYQAALDTLRAVSAGRFSIARDSSVGLFAVGGAEYKDWNTPL